MAVHNATMKWTEERTKELLHLWYVEKWKDSRIAKHFGTTRNVIAGKLHRERLKSGYAPKKRGPLGHARALPNKIGKPSLAPIPKARNVIPFAPKIEFAQITEGTGQPCTLNDLKGCKWPVGEVAGHPGRHIFCNAPKPSDPREPYCEVHRARAGETYRPWTDDEDLKIRKHWDGGRGKSLLSQMIHRTKSTIAVRAKKLGLPGLYE